MATVTTAVACVLIVIQTVIDIPKARNASAEHALLVKNGSKYKKFVDVNTYLL